MGSINQAIERQGQSKNSWKKDEIEMQKQIKEKELLLQRKNYFMQRKKVDADVEKARREAELIEEQKKSVMQDRLKKLLLDWKELLEFGVSREEIDLVLPLPK
jgi:hypothetical protein